ncbi:response regulator [Leptolyngbya sp. FACHB-541]|uniref:ATP-binding protein n=1 Tax=Leptolyngbya sp. FACHB-541 TaxID=2692810 RepID=UPI001682CD50|nr:ATP-binding protein [Leptolyngbya sp. FACHB-541]MBD1999791.1 response regulator [Leptolyngbya sp. FACHB-541]
MTVTATSEPPLVLVIDDDKLTRLELRLAMTQAGYRVAEATDGKEGLAVFEQTRPAIVLLDALMPVMDGFDCCRQLREMEAEDIPILMITSLENQESVDYAFEVGATDYITKPIHWAVLRQRVRRLIRAHQNTQELKRQNLRSQLFADITVKIRQSLRLSEILQTTVAEVQKILQADRVLIYKLERQSSRGITEAVGAGCESVLAKTLYPRPLSADFQKHYQQGKFWAIDDVETGDVPPDLIEWLHQFQVKAKLVVPILLKDELWGLLVVHHCSSLRVWSSFEIELLQQLANQVGIALTQVRLLEQERHQRQELARSNAELEQFAYVASHDLQEPLRMVASYVQLLERRYQDQLDQNARDFIAYAVDGTVRMQELIQALLSYSRIGTRGKEFRLTDCNSALDRALENLRLAIAETEAVITHDPLPELMADSIQLSQLFQNLLGNALKFRSDRPPVIHIGAVQKEESWLFSVQDNGIGMETKYGDRIFAIFQRLHSRTKYPGSGIGLAISKKIVERHGGQIWVESTPGEGTTFYFTIPVGDQATV